MADRATAPQAQINLLMRCSPQPASASAEASRHVEASRNLTVFNAFPRPTGDPDSIAICAAWQWCSRFSNPS
jgi:hypothetical protein